jgi:hypothetical protein
MPNVRKNVSKTLRKLGTSRSSPFTLKFPTYHHEALFGPGQGRIDDSTP